MFQWGSRAATSKSFLRNRPWMHTAMIKLRFSAPRHHVVLVHQGLRVSRACPANTACRGCAMHRMKFLVACMTVSFDRGCRPRSSSVLIMSAALRA